MKPFRLLQYLLFFIFITTGCNQNGKPQQANEQQLVPLIDRTDALAPLSTATLLFKGDSGSSIMLGYMDYLHSSNHVVLTESTDSVRISFRNFQFVDFMHRNGSPFLVLPGDRIEISADSSGKLLLEAHDTVRNSELNIYLRMVEATGARLGGITMLPVFDEKDIAKRDSLLHSRQQQVSSFLQQYARQHTLRPEVWQVTKEFLQHHDHLEKAMVLRLKGDNSRHDYHTSLTRYLQEQTFFSYYFTEFRSVTFLMAPLLMPKSKTAEEDLSGRYAFAGSYFDSSLVEPLQFLVLNSSRSRKRGNYEQYYNSYIRQYPETEFTRHLKKELAFNKTIDKQYKGTQLLGQAETILSLEEMIASKRGKVLYIDFWASWCMPCLKEIPYSIELKKKYTGTNIEFLYVSMDEVQTGWVKGQEKYPEVFKSRNSFLMLNNFNTPFAKNFKMQFIPRYMLVDRNGRIVDADAPRPSDGKALDHALEELML